MMNLSSPSKLRVLAFILCAIALVDTLVDLPEVYRIALAILCVAISALLFLGLSDISKILHKISTFCDRFSEGDFEARLIGTANHGILGNVCAKMNRVADLTDAYVREVHHSMEYVSQGLYYRKVLERGLPAAFRQSAHVLNKVTQATEARVQRYIVCTNEFEGNVDSVVKRLSNDSQDLKRSAISMTDNATLTTEKSMLSAQAATSATHNVQSVASAAEQLAASISEISRQIDVSNKETTAASQQATETDALVRGLSETAEKVGSVVKLINEIAEQTNLLALNATIEAARAGEAGKGFAVVAGEVKSLATQTTKATEEIVVQITSMQNATDKAAEAVAAITGKISHLNEITGTIASAISEQRAATQDIARSIQQAAEGTDQATAGIQEVNTTATETKKTAQIVFDVTQNIAEQSGFLQLEVSKFLNVIREK